jgi:septin family protein
MISCKVIVVGEEGVGRKSLINCLGSFEIND